MRNKAYDLNQWSFSDQDRVLPDANFWINVLGPAATVGQRGHRIHIYSRAFQDMLQNKVSLFIDVLILSEFVNALARYEFNANYRNSYGPTGFKQFRNSADFPRIARVIASQSKNILRCCERLDHAFSEWDVPQLLTNFENGGEDFNDQLIVEASKKHYLKILTDDADMITGGVTILTANARLLRACP